MQATYQVYGYAVWKLSTVDTVVIDQRTEVLKVCLKSDHITLN